MQLTPEQLDILDEPGNYVVIARPGSGKTETLARVIRQRLPSLPSYKGVVAISFTNKASRELRERSLDLGEPKKGSFFGTIDNFFLSEIVIPFGQRIFGSPSKEFSVVKLEDGEIETPLRTLDRRVFEGPLTNRRFAEVERLYRAGIIVLESAGLLAFSVLERSAGCRSYLKARFTDIIIDEYQDCGYWQHRFFLAACEVGLRGIAVGDLDQSIFSWAHKDPKYLADLAASGPFRIYPLTLNHRSHPALVHYVTKFISPNYGAPPPSENRIFVKTVAGDEQSIGDWLSIAVDYYCAEYSVQKRSDVGILVRNSRTGADVHRTLSIPHKLYLTTPLDEDNSPSSWAFREVLLWLFDPKRTRVELLDAALGPQRNNPGRRIASSELTELRTVVQGELQDLASEYWRFVRLAEILLNQKPTGGSVQRLREVLSREDYLMTYVPAENNEVQLLTIHKAKGLEFDLVFHLDLYEWILPNKHREQQEEANLHYVAMTRARHACILCVSTARHNAQGNVFAAKFSEFVTRVDLTPLHVESPV